MFQVVRRFQQSLTRWASLTEIFHGVFHCRLNSGLVQNSYRQVKLKCRLHEGQAGIFIFIEPCLNPISGAK